MHIIFDLYFAICAFISYVSLKFKKPLTVSKFSFPVQNFSRRIVNVRELVLGKGSKKSLILSLDKQNDQPKIGYLLFELMSRIPFYTSGEKWSSYEEAKQFVEGYSEYLTPFCRYYNYDNFTENTHPKKLLKMVVDKGVAANLLTYDSSSDTYFVDVMSLSEYEVREPYIRYGAKAVFNNKLEIISITTAYHGKTIYYDQQPSSLHREMQEVQKTQEVQEMQEAVNIFISSACAYSYIVIHTLYCHLSTLGGINGAINETFDVDHRLYKLLWPVLHKLTYITSGNVISYSKGGGIINRLFAFTTDGYSRLMNDHVDKFQLLQFDTLVQQQGMHNEYSRISMIYWDTIKEFVSGAVQTLSITNEEKQAFVFNSYKYLYNLDASLRDYDLDEKFIRILTSFIFNATVWHKQVEITLDNLIDPRMLKPKISKDAVADLVDTVQNTREKMILLVFTNLLMRSILPIGEDYSPLYPEDMEASKLWLTFGANLSSRLVGVKFACLLPQNVRVL